MGRRARNFHDRRAKMNPRLLVGALVAAGVIGTGLAAYEGRIEAPFTRAHATPVAEAPLAVAAPAANPASTTLPLNGFTDLVKRYGPAVVNVSVDGMRKVSDDGDDDDDAASQQQQMPDLDQLPPGIREFFRGFGGGGGFQRMPQQAVPMRGEG